MLDPNVQLPLNEEMIDQAWVVRKPTMDGRITSLELMDAKGGIIAQLFGKRKPGELEREEWRSILAALPQSYRLFRRTRFPPAPFTPSLSALTRSPPTPCPMHNLHGPDRLFSTRYGCVLQCDCCDRIQITFREHTLLVDEDELDVLVDTIKHAWEEMRDADGQDQWTLRAGTGAGPVSIPFSEPSLRSLHALLQGAWSMYTLQERVGAVASGAKRAAPTVLRDHTPAAHSRWGGGDR